MLRVLIVDDSSTARLLLRHAIDSAPDMQVIGEAHDGQQGVEMVQQLKPDIILMDISMPRMDGMEATRRIMGSLPTPIVMVSASVEGRENETAFQALKLGALTLLAKPVGPADPAYSAQIGHLVKTVRALAGVQVIHHKESATAKPRATAQQAADLLRHAAPQIVLIGASTGGPAALSEIVRGLGGGFPLPVVIAQHIAQDFVPSLVHWFRTLTPMPVLQAEPGQLPQPGQVYISPAHTSLYFKAGGLFALDHDLRAPYQPSIDRLFSSAAVVYGSRALGVLLTGMGADGAEGLLALAQAGAVTIAQDEATAAVYGMPKAAAERGAARQVLPLPQITAALVALKQH